MIKLTEGGFSEMWNGRKSPEIEALSYAIRMQAVRIIAAADKTSCYAGVDELPEEILDYFAQELRALYYDETASIGRKRTIIKNTMPWYERNGTAGALVGMLSEETSVSGRNNESSITLSDISETVERAAEKAIERMLPSFLAGYMACAAGFNPEGYAVRQTPSNTSAIEENDEDAADDIDFDFLGLN